MHIQSPCTITMVCSPREVASCSIHSSSSPVPMPYLKYRLVDKKNARRYDDCLTYSVVASKKALKQAGLDRQDNAEAGPYKSWSAGGDWHGRLDRFPRWSEEPSREGPQEDLTLLHSLCHYQHVSTATYILATEHTLDNPVLEQCMSYAAPPCRV